MKICMTLQGFPPDLLGGTEATVRSLSRSLRDRGHEVLVVAGTDQWQEGFRISHEVQEGIGVYRIHRDDPHYAHWHKGSCGRTGDAFTEILERERPDIVHVHHWLRLTHDLARRAVDAGIPAVVSLHDLSSTCLVHHRIRPEPDLDYCAVPLAPEPCIRCAEGMHLSTPWISEDSAASRVHALQAHVRDELRAASAVTALSTDQAAKLHRFLEGAGEILVVPPTLRPEELPAPRPPRALPAKGEPVRLGAWGTLGLLKGLDMLVRAVRRAVDAGARLEVEIAGQDSHPDYANSVRAAAEGLPIRFHGPYSSIEGNPATDVHAFVSATRAHETWGLVADEAVAIGLPMLLPRAGAFVERFEPGGALFYASGDEVALADLLVRVAREPQLLESTRRDLGRAWQPDEWSRRFETIYADALANGPAQPPPGREAELASEADWMRTWNQGFEQAF